MGQCSTKQRQSVVASSQLGMFESSLFESSFQSKQHHHSNKRAAPDGNIHSRSHKPRRIVTYDNDVDHSQRSIAGTATTASSSDCQSSLRSSQRSPRSRYNNNSNNVSPSPSPHRSSRHRDNSTSTTSSSSSRHSHHHHPQRQVQQQVVQQPKRRSNNINSTYQILPGVTGHGIAGQVRQCIHRTTSELCAVKTIDKSRIRRKDRIRREVAFLKQVRHPNIIKMYDVFNDDSGNPGENDEDKVHIVMEMCHGGELFDKIVEKAMLGKSKRTAMSNKMQDQQQPPDVATTMPPTCYDEKQAASIITQVLSAISYLHSNDIIHRDIKPENVLFANKDNDGDSPFIKLIDFGLSIRHTTNCDPLINTVGTSYYMAPEVLSGSYDRSCDLWSIGVLTYVMLTGIPPFNGSNDEVICKKIRRGQYKSLKEYGVSEDACDFIGCLLDMNPGRRWSADMALEHEWIRMHYDSRR